VIYGEEGVVQVDHFHQRPSEVIVTAYGRRGRTEPLAYRSFAMREYSRPLPEFAGRFGLAYMAEVATFVERCQSGKPFPLSHRDGARAQQVIQAGMKSEVRPQPVTPVG
jgi:predicted dehydrogenase